MSSNPLPPGIEDQPIRDGSPLLSFLFVVRKAHRELVGPELARLRFHEVQTHGHARRYLEDVMPALLAHRRERRHPPVR